MQSDKEQKQDLTDESTQAEQAAVKQWTEKYRASRKRWEKDFDRMRACARFAMGYQREDQGSLESEEYTVNLILRNINQKVASLYAKNPTVEYQRRKRLDFQLWDGKMESLAPIAQKVAVGLPMMPNEMALVNDYLTGTQLREQVERVGKTLAYLYQYQTDEHDPDFKEQMKQLVRRVCTCGVGYVRVAFVRDVENALTSAGMDNSPVDRVKMIQAVAKEIEDESLDVTSPKYEQLRSLMSSLALSMSGQDYEYNTSERLSFDFLPSTSVIPDERCRNLKGFIGSRAVFVEYILPLDEVNAFFETDIKAGGEVKSYSSEGAVEEKGGAQFNENQQVKNVCLIEVLDKQTKTHFYIVDGHKDYVQKPEPLEPCVRGFWPLFALTFNDIEPTGGKDSTIFPPSDVLLMKHPQQEWNRTREDLRKHRNANSAKYITQKGWLEESDKDKLEFSEPNAVIELQGLKDGMDVSKALAPMAHDVIQQGDPRYTTVEFEKDILLSVGAQEANLGPPNPKGTATGQSIAEQSRSVGISSNVDDLDDFLSHLACAGGEMLLQEASQDTVQRIVGPGASWPTENREQFLNELFLKCVAASSGKPNKVLELQNWNLIAQTLQAAGANPQFMVRETIRRVDDRLDPDEAFPLVQNAQMAMQQQQAQPRQLPPHQAGQAPRPQRRPGPGKTGPQQVSRPMAGSQQQ